MKVYLAGPISWLTYEQATQWRKEAKEQLEKLGFTVIDPMRQKEPTGDILENENGTRNGIQYWTQDRLDIEQCDILLVNFLDAGLVVSIGTCVEIGMAVQLNIPIVVIMEQDNVHQHPFITTPAEYIANVLEHAIGYCEFIKDFPEKDSF